MSNPFEALTGGLVQQPAPNPTALPHLPQPSVDWFNLDNVDPYNLGLHQQQAAAQQAYIMEQLAGYERKLLQLGEEADRAKARALYRASTTSQLRDSVKVPGTREEFLPPLDVAKAHALDDADYIKASNAAIEARHLRDVWAGYASSMRTKIKMLMCLSGLTRAELEAFKAI